MKKIYELGGECMTATEVAEVISLLEDRKVIYSVNPMFEGKYFSIYAIGDIPAILGAEPLDGESAWVPVLKSLYGDYFK